MNNRRKTIAIISIALIAVLVAAAIYISFRLGQAGVTPSAPGSRPQACDSQCPAASNHSLLVSCTASGDGTYNSLCNSAGRVEQCGGRNYCCPSAGGEWTTNMSACPQATASPTATAAPTATPTVSSECGTCGGTSNNTCASGLSCDLTDGRCKKTDGSSKCFETSSVCSITATAICVPTTTVTCSPDCPTACGTAASIITTCTNSCGQATTKNCPATAACGVVTLDLTQKTYRDNTTTEISSVAKNQTFAYALILKNTGNMTGTGISLTDTLDGNNQELLTFVSVDSGCTYSSADKKVTCSNISLNPNATKTIKIRVKLTGTTTNGTVISNRALASYSSTTVTADKNITVLTTVACNQSCSNNTDCASGLTCDDVSGTCRKSTCAEETDCVCPTAGTGATITSGATVTTTVTSSITTSPTITATPTEAGIAQLPGTEEITPTTLPETGILDFPGIAAFGGGLMLAVVGILLAL